MKNWLDGLIDDYFDFLKANTIPVLNTGSEWAVISTPFIGLFNDTIEIYIKREGDKILLSDDGATSKNLEFLGVPLTRSPKRREALNRILLTYGIDYNDSELTTIASEKTFAQKKHNFVSAIAEISDIYMLSKSSVGSFFREDVQEYLDKNGLVYTPQFISRGITGLDFTFDFQVAYRDKEIILKSFNTINKLTLTNFLFTWDDVKTYREKITRKQIEAIAVINNDEKEVNPLYLEALSNKNTAYILWSARDEAANVNKLRDVA